MVASLLLKEDLSALVPSPAPVARANTLGAGVFILAGNMRRISWALGLTGQLFWASYAIWLAQWGLLIGCCFYGSVYVRNWLKWKPAATEPTPCACCESTVDTCNPTIEPVTFEGAQ